MDAGEQIRLILGHPQQLGGGEARKGDVGGVAAEHLPAHLMVEPVHLGGSAAIVPQNGGAQHLPLVVQSHQAVHLAPHPDARHLGGVHPLQQLGDAGHTGRPPVLGVLLTPARLGKIQGVVPAHRAAHRSRPIHQQEFAGGRAQINANIVQGLSPPGLWVVILLLPYHPRPLPSLTSLLWRLDKCAVFVY